MDSPCRRRPARHRRRHRARRGARRCRWSGWWRRSAARGCRRTVRVGFALLLALVAAPALVGDGGRRRAGRRCRRWRFTLLLAREVVVGLCLGLVASAAFRAAEIAGRLGDTLRGANVAEILVPTAEERASPLGVALPAAGDDRLPADRGRAAAGRGAAVQLPDAADRGRPGRARPPAARRWWSWPRRRS